MITASVDILCAEMKFLISVNRVIKNYKHELLKIQTVVKFIWSNIYFAEC